MSDETTNKYLRDDLGLMHGALDKLKDYRCLLVGQGERNARYLDVLTEVIDELDRVKGKTMTDHASFKDFNFNNFNYEKIIALPFIEVDKCDYETRIYFKPIGGNDQNGFEALILSCIKTTWPEDGCKDHPPFSPGDGIMLRGHILAYFDGINHFYIEYDEQYKNYGYIHYPNLDEWIEIFKSLKLLEKSLCREP